MKATEILLQMGQRGMKVDMAGLKLRVEEARQAAMCRSEFKVAHGFDALARKFPASFNLKSTAAEYLERSSHPLAPEVLRVRRAVKRFGDLNGLLGRVSEDGRIRWEWSTAKTGRQYATGGLLTMSRECREFLIPDNGRFVLYDFKAQELRLIALFTNCAKLKQVLEEGDIHQEVATIVGWNRDKAKMLNYAILYSMDLDMQAERFKIGTDERDELAKLLPVAELIEAGKRSRKGDCITTLLGREVPIDPEDEKTLGSYLVQGSGFDVLVKALENLEEAGHPLPVMVIHDAILFDGDPGDVRACIELEIDGMKFPVERKEGANWSEVTG